MAPKVSLVAPVYNSARYLERCLRSLTTQTLGDIEIIIVNDASPLDTDHKTCERFANSDRRIKYILHNENRGLGGARNTGIENAKAEYIWFVDTDDFIDINACEFLYRSAKANEVDVIGFSATTHLGGLLEAQGCENLRYGRDETIVGQVLRGREFFEEALITGSFHVSACLHWFSREHLTGKRFREGVYHEDTDFTPLAIYEADRVWCTKYAPYYRAIRDGSITQMAPSEKVLRDKIAYVRVLIDYVVKRQIQAPSILIDYCDRQYRYVKGQVLDEGLVSEETEGELANLGSLYQSVIAGRSRDLTVLDCASIRRRYSETERELDRLSRSLLGRVTFWWWSLWSSFGKRKKGGA